MPFSSLARLTRQHARRLVMPPFLAFSVSLGTAFVPSPAHIPGVNQASMMMSMTPWSTERSEAPSTTVQSTAPSAPAVFTLASSQVSATPAEPAAPIVNVPASNADAVSDVQSTSTDMPAAIGTPMHQPTTPAVASSQTLAWGKVVSPAFVAKVRQICADLGCQADDLMAAIAFESVETFSPSVRNPMSSATGLIQFMSDTARNLGTSTDELAQMSAEEQLTYVEAYFKPYRGHLATLSDIYMAILWPRAVGQPEDFPLFQDGSIQYAQNAHLDVDGDGVVTKHEAAGLVTAKLRKGQRDEYLLVETPAVASSTATRS